VKYLIALLCMGIGFFLGYIPFKNEKKDPEMTEVQNENHLDSKILEILKTPTRVKFTRVSPTGFAPGGTGKEYLLQNTSIVLNSFQTGRLQKLLLSSENFIWNKTKRGLFLPTSVFYFEKGARIVIVLISLPLNQIQMIEDERMVTLDYDPMQGVFNEYINELIKDLK